MSKLIKAKKVGENGRYPALYVEVEYDGIKYRGRIV